MESGSLWFVMNSAACPIKLIHISSSAELLTNKQNSIPVIGALWKNGSVAQSFSVADINSVQLMHMGCQTVSHCQQYSGDIDKEEERRLMIISKSFAPWDIKFRKCFSSEVGNGDILFSE